MPEKPNNLTDKINHLFRYEYGKLVSVLTKTFGPTNIELAEDVVQDAMLEAVSMSTYKIPLRSTTNLFILSIQNQPQNGE